MPIEGPLRELALSDVFQLLDLSRKTGVLTVRNDSRDHPATVRFDRGRVVSAARGDNGSRLGHLLLRAGKITEAELERARACQAEQPGRPLGEIFVQQGMVSEPEVRKHARFQIEEVVYDLIRWKDGYFRFEEAPPPEAGAGAVRIATESLLMEAARQIDEWTTLAGKIPHMGVVPALVGGEPGEGSVLDLHPDEWEVLAEIDGTRSLKKIATELARGDFDVAKIVFGLVSTGVVEIVEEDRAALPPAAPQANRVAEAEAAVAAEDYSRAQALLADLLLQNSERADLHLLSGRALSGAGRWREAVDAFARASQIDPLGALAHYHRGFAAVRCGDLDRAREAWSTFLRLPESADLNARTVYDGLALVQALAAVLQREGE